jgi:type 1 glutamine amidotransferase
MKYSKIVFATLFILSFCSVKAQLPEFKLTDEWVQKIEKLAPAKAEALPAKHHKVLVFSLFTGFDHWVVPHVNAVLKVLAEKAGAFEIEMSNDIYKFEKKNLKEYDAVILNNNCSVGPRRDLLLDVLDKDKNLTDDQRKKKAAELESNLISYVKKGGGLMVIHGAIVMQNNSVAFSEMVGGSFDYHPVQQEVMVELCEPNHPLVKAFEGKPFVHTDEPYLFNNAYSQKNFRPLLYMDTSKLIKKSKEIDEKIKYVAWIKRCGKGRVFYVSPGHNAQSYEDTRLLKLYLDGVQYVLGDLKCDDSPAQFEQPKQ